MGAELSLFRTIFITIETVNKKGQTSDGLAWAIIAVFVALMVGFSALSSTAGDDGS